MILVFVDETSDSKFKNYFGLSCAVIQHGFYPKIKTRFHDILIHSGWDPNIEFKGSYLFSASSGCTDISIEKRIEIAEAIIDLNIANTNARMNFAYLKTETENEKQDYLSYLPLLLSKVLKKPKKSQGKNLISIQCDYRSDISSFEIHKAIQPTLQEKGFVLLENVTQVTSSFETVGIAYADIVGFLAARIDIISTDSELFQNIPPEYFETNGKIRKLRSSKKLIEKIKNLTWIQVLPEK